MSLKNIYPSREVQCAVVWTVSLWAAKSYFSAIQFPNTGLATSEDCRAEVRWRMAAARVGDTLEGGQCSQCSRLQLASLRSCRWRALHLPQCAKERAKARAEEPSEAPAAAAGRDHYAIIGTRNLATSGFKSRLRSMKVSSRINGEFRFMTGKNINSAIISDMGRNGLWVHN